MGYRVENDETGLAIDVDATGIMAAVETVRSEAGEKDSAVYRVTDGKDNVVLVKATVLTTYDTMS